MAAPVADRRQARRDRTKRQIVAAAWQLARRDGIAQLSLRDLAAEVGMRAPSLYGYFASKDAIYDAMFAQGYRELDVQMETVVAGLADDVDPAERLTVAARAFLTFCTADLARYQLMFTRTVPGWEPSPQAYAVSIASYEQMTLWMAQLGVTAREDLDLWSAITAGLAAQQAANEPGGDRYVRLVGDAVRMFLEHVRETHR